MNRIVPLSHKSLDGVVSLIYDIFPYKYDRMNATVSFKKSLEKPDSIKNYWILKTHENRVIGVIGLYRDQRDETVLWIGWFGVHPEYRRKGIGSRLLRHAIKKANIQGAKTLKVYSSFDKNELASHSFYENHGFIKTYVNRRRDRVYFAKSLQ